MGQRFSDERSSKATDYPRTKPAYQLEQSVGEAVRRLRDRQRISVRMLASKCGFSPSFISQVELNQASPSLSSLERIASGLGVTLGEFFHSVQTRTPQLIRSDQRSRLQSQWSRSHIELLGHPGSGRSLEALLVTIAPGGSSGKGLHARETELFVMVFAGRVKLELEEGTQVLRRGDAITLPGGTLHRWENAGRTNVQLIKIIPR